MAIVHFDSVLPDEARRERLFRGEIFVFSPTKQSRALVGHARGMIEQAFHRNCQEFCVLGPVHRFTASAR